MNDHLVAFCVPTLRNGGAEKALAELATACAGLDWNVDMVILDSSSPDYLQELSPRVQLVNLGQAHTRTSVPALIRYLRERRPAALFSTGSHMNCAAVVAAKLAFTRTRIVLREADTMFEWHSGTTRLLVSMLYRIANSIVAVSDDVKKNLVLKARLPAGRICVIRNSVNVERIRELARAELTTPFTIDDVPVVLGVGRLEPVKDFSTLVRAFALVHAHRRCRLVILGRGSQLMELRELANGLGISSHVAFPGFVQNPYTWMARSDVFVLSSLREGCPNALLQALACGCAVVATDAPGDARFLLRNGTLGRLTPVGDADAMAGAIEDTLNERGTATRTAAVEEWLQMFEPRAAAVAYLRAAGLSPQPEN